MRCRATGLLATARLGGVALLPLLASAAAAVPTTMTYVGVLADQGNRVNGAVDASFVLFSSSAGGEELYREDINGLVVVGGELVVELGANALDDSLLAREELWLEVSIDGEVMSPRVRLNSVPYALLARVAEETLTFGGLQPLDYVTQAQLANLGLAAGLAAGTGLTKNGGTLSIASGGVTLGLLAANSVDGSKIVDGSVGTADLANGAVTAAKVLGAIGLFRVSATACVEPVGLITVSPTCVADTAGCAAGERRNCSNNACLSIAPINCNNERIGTMLPP
jgi:hypothetical protein